jgi:hypothetical protein|nr:hypothetical protein [Kofleriaceae bacterium]
MRSTWSLALLAAAVSACSIGTPGGADIPDSPPPPIDAAPICLNAASPPPGGPLTNNLGDGGGSNCNAGSGSGLAGSAACDHQAGNDCLGCHGEGNNTANNAPLFSVAGTLYDGPEGVNPVIGATIVIVDSMGSTLNLATATNGNFYASAPVQLPITVKASQCPGTHTMVEATTGQCNSSGCHNQGSVNGRAYLVPGAP